MRALAWPLLLLIAGCDLAPETPRPQPVTQDFPADPTKLAFIDPAQIPKLQSMASDACRCTRSKGYEQKDACWSEFWTNANRYNSITAATACGPGSSAFVEFSRKPSANESAESSDSQFDPAMMVTTEWGYGACAPEEVSLKKREYEQKNSVGGC